MSILMRVMLLCRNDGIIELFRGRLGKIGQAIQKGATANMKRYDTKH